MNLRTTKIIVLDNKLEYHLRKLGWKESMASSIDSDEAYTFIFNLIHNKNRIIQIENQFLESNKKSILRDKLYFKSI